MLQDRSGGDIAYLATNAQRFIEAANRRPAFTNRYNLYRLGCVPLWTAAGSGADEGTRTLMRRDGMARKRDQVAMTQDRSPSDRRNRPPEPSSIRSAIW
jgi:hypothetical protein